MLRRPALRFTLAGVGLTLAATGTATADPTAAQLPARPRHPLPTAPRPGATPACGEGATMFAVPDTAPIKRCPEHPLEQACMREGGIKHGERWVWDADRACALPRRTEHYEAGIRTGLAVSWQSVCAGKGAACTARVAEIGAYQDGKQHGPWQVYAASGALLEDRNYEAGQPQGWWIRQATSGVELVCYQAGKETWRGAPQAEGRPAECPDALIKVADDGTVEVDESQRKASRMVALAQATKNLDLRVRYLKKACELAPANEGYKKLLAAAESEAAATRPAPKP